MSLPSSQKLTSVSHNSRQSEFLSVQDSTGRCEALHIATMGNTAAGSGKVAIVTGTAVSLPTFGHIEALWSLTLHRVGYGDRAGERHDQARLFCWLPRYQRGSRTEGGS